ncbi:MAG: hypothetical protein ACXWEK_03360, partial [Solirubrobacterales bacterium]
LAVLLACFAGPKLAAKAHRPLDGKLRSSGDVILDTVVLRVNEKHKTSLYDPRRVLAGTLTPALTWGLFGLVTSGVQGLVIWAVLGALCGWLFTYYSYSARHATKAQIARIGARLPSNSSALLTFAETSDPGRLLAATADHEPSVASIAMIGEDLTARVFAGADDPVEVDSSDAQALPLDQTAMLSMILLRYPDPGTAKQAASGLAAGNATVGDATEVELVIETDREGHTQVSDPKLGAAAVAKSDLVSWGGFGVVCGGIAGASGGGILEGGLITGIGWGLFGLFAGALYGLWAGRSVSARRLKGIGPLMAPGTSMLLAWAEGSVSQQTIDTLTGPQSQRLVLRFNPIERGAVLEVA